VRKTFGQALGADLENGFFRLIDQRVDVFDFAKAQP
jgi:hypothetical protein